MNLKDFVKSAIIDITDAVMEARESAKVEVAPSLVTKSTGQTYSYENVSEIDFDIATTVNTAQNIQGEMSGKTGALIEVVGLKLGAEGSMSREHRNDEITRIKFSVPVMYAIPAKKK